MNLLKQLWQSGESLAVRLEKKRWLLITGFTVSYGIATLVLSRRKLLWNDELYTYYIANLPTMTDVWGALMSGGEQLPPFFYLLTRLSITLLGKNNFNLRLPEMIGFMIMCISLFIFVARRTSNLYGLLAAIFPLVSFTYYYAYEARPYGLVLGFSSLALLSWQSVTMKFFRIVSIISLAISLAGAISSHYYGIFAILPLALGETVRTFARRRVDRLVWAAFCLAIVPLVWHLPLIQQARTYSGSFWAKAAWMNIPYFYSNMFSIAAVPLIMLLFFSGLYQTALREKMHEESREIINFKLPAFEVAAALGFIITPVICIILGKLVTGAFTDRYAIIAIIGFSILVPFIAAKLNNNNSLVSIVLIVCFFGWFGFLAFKDSWRITGFSPKTKIQLLQSKGDDILPIVAADPHTFIELNYYAPEIRSRVIYLADPEASLRRLSTNSIEHGMVDLLKPWFRLQVTDYKSYIVKRPQFLLCGNPQFFSWIVPQLEEDGMQLELKGFQGEIMLFMVYPP